MKGSWHLYRPGERWMRRRHDMRIVVGTEAWEAVAFNVPTAEFLDAGDAGRSAGLGDLGPDLLSPEFDADEAVLRLAALTDVEIGEALLDQHALAGIGNIYKSETLFACGVSPFAPIGNVSRETLAKIVSTARRFLQANSSPEASDGGSATVRTGRRSVYGRGGMACRRCGRPIMRRAQGPNARGTFWCPRCQANP
jgi:endonuclease-8